MTTLARWDLQMIFLGTQRKANRYNMEFKEGAVRLVLEEGRGAPRLGMATSTMREWLKQASQKQGEGFGSVLTCKEREK